MGLAGNLEDLCVADVLQILGLSRKTGALRLVAEGDEVAIWMHEGRALGAVSKRGPADLRELLMRGGRVSVEQLVEPGSELSAALEARLLTLDPDGMAPLLEHARREALEEIVIELFGWTRAAFVFEPGETPPESARFALLREPLAAESLAMEAARRFDERRHEASAPALDAEDDPFASLRFSGEETGIASLSSGARMPEAAPAAEAVRAALLEQLVERTVEREQAEAELAGRDETASEATRGDAPLPAAQSGARLPAVAIVIEPELPALDWLRGALAPVFTRIHPFQRSEQGIARLRQYLVRGEVPAVLVSDRAMPDPVSGARDAAALLERVRALSPRAFTALVADAASRRPVPRAARVRLLRPQDLDLIGMARAPRRDEAAGRLRDELVAAVRAR